MSFKNVIIPFNWDKNLNRKFIYANDFNYKSEILKFNIKLLLKPKGWLFSEIYEKEIELNFMDNINKLYVAMTRAVDRLYIYSKKPSKSQLENKFEHLQKGYLNSFCLLKNLNILLFLVKKILLQLIKNVEFINKDKH